MAQQAQQKQQQSLPQEFESLWESTVQQGQSSSQNLPQQPLSQKPLVSQFHNMSVQPRSYHQPYYHQPIQTQPIHFSDQEMQLERALDKVLAQDDPLFEQVWNDNLMSRPEFEPVQKKQTQYVFETVNQYLDHPEPYAEATRMLEQKQSHSCSDIALALEAEVQKNHQNSTAWTQLGLIQQENEKEEPAILAFEQALRLNPSDTEALMALAVSYTNEAQDNEAFRVLAQWLHYTYGDNVWDEKTPIHEVFDDLCDTFLKHARQQSTAALQIGMGILFYNSAQYQKSIDCFSAALQETPQDYILWNRLGATMANSGESEQAIAAYHRALELSPNFVRARYNLGVSCMNIGCHEEAALHFLQALSCQSVGLKLSNNLYETLRKTFSILDRDDLAAKCHDGVNVQIFKGEFGF